MWAAVLGLSDQEISDQSKLASTKIWQTHGRSLWCSFNTRVVRFSAHKNWGWTESEQTSTVQLSQISESLGALWGFRIVLCYCSKPIRQLELRVQHTHLSVFRQVHILVFPFDRCSYTSHCKWRQHPKLRLEVRRNKLQLTHLVLCVEK